MLCRADNKHHQPSDCSLGWNTPCTSACGLEFPGLPPPPHPHPPGALVKGERCEQDPHTRGLGKEPLSRAPPAPTEVLRAGLRDSARVPVGGQRLASGSDSSLHSFAPSKRHKRAHFWRRLGTITSSKRTHPPRRRHLQDSGWGPPLPACAPEEPEPCRPAKFTRLPRSERGAELRTQRQAEPAWGTRGKGSQNGGRRVRGRAHLGLGEAQTQSS